MERPEKCCDFGEFKCQIPMPIAGRKRSIDLCIADIVASLNAANITTIASCCGHGKQDGSICLVDGRELLIRKFDPKNHVIDHRAKWFEKLKTARKKLGLTLRDVEKKTGVSNPLISQIETGKIKNPSVFTIASLIQLYGVNFYDVFGSTQ